MTPDYAVLHSGRRHRAQISFNLKNARKGLFADLFQREAVESSIANSEILRQPKMGEFAQSIQPRLLFAEHSHAHLMLDQVLRPALVAKTLDQPHPTEVGKVASPEGKMDRTGSFWYRTQSTLTVTFV